MQGSNLTMMTGIERLRTANNIAGQTALSVNQLWNLDMNFDVNNSFFEHSLPTRMALSASIGSPLIWPTN